MAGGLGAELRRLWDRPPTVKREAKGWQAQINALTATPRGQIAAVRVGLHVKDRRTLERWLAFPAMVGGRSQEPTSANKRLISAAYRYLIGGWDDSVERREYSITGEIDSGDRSENRELIIDGRPGDWEPIREAYLSGASDEELEDLFIEHVIEEDVGPTSGEGWGFPGTSYSVQ